MRYFICGVIYMVILATGAPAWGHGTGGSTQNALGIMVSAEYDDGEPMSYAGVEITGPEGGMVFQKGRTDRNGVFMFLPDRSGRWQIVVKDRMGHLLTLEREVTMEADTLSPAESLESSDSGISRTEGSVAGIGIIFGLCGLAYGWKARSRPAGIE